MSLSNPRLERPALLALACAVLAPLAATIFGYALSPGARVVSGPRDGPFFVNFHPVERGVRWSKGGDRRARASRLRLPQLGSASGVLELSVRPPGTEPIELTAATPDRTVFEGPIRGAQVLRLSLSAADFTGGDLVVTLESPAWRRPRGVRSFGVGIDEIRWRPDAPVMPPLRQLLAWPALGALSWLLCVTLGQQPRRAAIGSGIVASMLALGAGLFPLQIATYATHLLLLAACGLAVAWLWGALPRPAHEAAADATPRTASAVDGAALVLLFGIGHFAAYAFSEVACRRA